uniref:Transcription factor TFIIIB component B'' Myb domain-containing protein n=1 Tax=Anopheles dirus TaxID=7168 RepID=A0A182NGT2_9DIPT
MATRRPRVKVAANLSIRRPSKANATTVAGEPIKQELHQASLEPANESASNDGDAVNPLPPPSPTKVVAEEEAKTKFLVPVSKPEESPEEPRLEFKLPKPVDEIAKSNLAYSQGGTESPSPTAANTNNTCNDEPMSPRKQDTQRSIFTLPLARKRNRTESLTSNKSLPEGVIVNKVTRKVATRQEESQRTLDNKKEIRKRLTNIENVDKQNLTMFDMIYYNPVNNPMTPPALSKRGSLENIPKSVDGRSRSRSVSKSRSPTPAPSGSATVATGTTTSAVPTVPAPPVQLTPQLKLGPNGEMILDEASLVIENEREKEMRETLANTDIVYQDEFSGNSGYYSRIRRTKDWGDDETIRFYRCLHTIGTDFSMMLSLFPQRSRRDLKLKFKKEERLNLRLVNKALLYPKQFNLNELREQFAAEDELLEQKRREEQQRKQEAQEHQQKESLRKKLMMRMSSSNPQKRLSRSERALTDLAEVTGEDLHKPKRAAKKRSTAKPPTSPAPSSVVEEKVQNPQQQQEQQQQQRQYKQQQLEECPPVDSIVVVVDRIDSNVETPGLESVAPERKNRATPKTSSERKSLKRPSSPSPPLPPPNDVVLKEEPHYQQLQQNEYVPEESVKMATIVRMDDTPVDIPDPKYEPAGHLVLTCGETNMAQDGGLYSTPATANTLTQIQRANTQQLIDWPPAPGTDTVPFVVYGKLDTYGSSNGTVIIPDCVPDETVRIKQSDNTAPDVVTNESESDLHLAAKTPKSETPPIPPERAEVIVKSPPPSCEIEAEEPRISESAPAPVKEPVNQAEHEEKEEEDEEMEEEEDDDENGGFSLEDIDLNSLVLVESQDTGDPNRTFYEIYISNPDTGQLSEKPLDVPADVIENIRQILEAGSGGGDR